MSLLSDVELLCQRVKVILSLLTNWYAAARDGWLRRGMSLACFVTRDEIMT